MALTSSGDFFYTTLAGGDVVAQYTANSSTGALTPMSQPRVATGENPSSLVINNDTYVYVTNAESNTISQYVIGLDGTLSSMSSATIKTDNYPWGITLSPNRQYVYVANVHSGSVSQYTVSLSGSLVQMDIPSVAAESGALSVTVTPNGKFAYTINKYSSSVSQYMVDSN